jgi:DNA-binding response OmpR family regulator
LLLAEDDDAARAALVTALQREGYDVDDVADGQAAVAAAASTQHALVILDVEMPILDGFEACRRIRAARPAVPIMLLTGHAAELETIAGLDAGADDYVTKPFRFGELLARVRAQLRRSAADVVVAGDVRVDKAARRAFHGPEELALSAREFDLLALLVEHAGRTVTRDEVTHALWQGAWFGSPKTLNMHLMALRRKLGDDGREPRHLLTVRGIGFRFEP